MKKRLIKWILKHVDWEDVGRIVVNLLLDRLKKAETAEEKMKWIRKFEALAAVCMKAVKALDDFNLDKAEFAEIKAALEEAIKK